jgi:hypothetical protein
MKDEELNRTRLLFILHPSAFILAFECLVKLLN